MHRLVCSLFEFYNGVKYRETLLTSVFRRVLGINGRYKCINFRGLFNGRNELKLALISYNGLPRRCVSVYEFSLSLSLSLYVHIYICIHKIRSLPIRQKYNIRNWIGEAGYEFDYRETGVFAHLRSQSLFAACPD